MSFLRTILDFLFPPRDAQALIDHATPETFGRMLAPVSLNENIVALLPYRTALVKAGVTEAKFRDNRQAQRLLGIVLADYVREDAESVVLVPVPLSPERLKERGYNQCQRIAEEARRLVPELTLETDLLVRVRNTLPQTSLDGAARRENLAGAFGIQGTPNPTHTYIVLDDVFTTGATLQEAVSALKAAGAIRVSGLSLAH